MATACYKAAVTQRSEFHQETLLMDEEHKMKSLSRTAVTWETGDLT